MAIFPSAALAKFQMPPQLQSNMLTALAPQQTSFAPPAPASPGPAVSDAKTSVLNDGVQSMITFDWSESGSSEAETYSPSESYTSSASVDNSWASSAPMDSFQPAADY
jgi:hypothetical protein